MPVSASRARVVGAATLALAVWAVVVFVPWRPGWSALTWDDFIRVAMAMRWAEHPYVTVGTMLWLPLQTWIYGLGLTVTGTTFASNPMLLAAVVNAVAVAGAAALVGRTAWRLGGSAAGGLLAFATVLFAPWVVYTTRSGLSEPLYYLGIATAVWALVARQQGGGLGTIAIGSLGAAGAAALRYEGWLLVPVWTLCVLATVRPTVALRAWRNGGAVLIVAAAPFLVPAAWMTLHAVYHGHPFSFTAATANAFASSYGAELFATLGGRLAYYPAGLLRSAPLVFPLLAALTVLAAWRAPQSRLLVSLVVLHLALFYATSVVSRSVGAFTERFMFAFVLGLAPLLGLLPGFIGRLRSRPARAAVTTALLAAIVAESGHGLARHPEEWSHPADLMEVTTLLGDWARTRSAPLAVRMREGLEGDILPLRVQNGRRVALTVAPDAPVDRVPAGTDVFIERLPARVPAVPFPPAAIVGRYHLYGPAVSVPPGRAGQALGEWRRVDERGMVTTFTPLRVVGLEFTGDDPPPGTQALVERAVPRGERRQRGSLAVRWMYGHGFNRGRIDVEVRVDGRSLFRTDVGTPSRWHTVSFEVPPGPGASTVTVALHASPRIEAGWKWGRNSTVLARDLALTSDEPVPVTRSDEPPRSSSGARS